VSAPPPPPGSRLPRLFLLVSLAVAQLTVTGTKPWPAYPESPGASDHIGPTLFRSPSGGGRYFHLPSTPWVPENRSFVTQRSRFGSGYPIRMSHPLALPRLSAPTARLRRRRRRYPIQTRRRRRAVTGLEDAAEVDG
jgi:hypothetical protein